VNVLYNITNSLLGGDFINIKYYCYVLGSNQCKISDEEERKNYSSKCKVREINDAECKQSLREYEDMNKNDGSYYDGEFYE